ncbi:hypothetical protein K4F52_002369 [Lecanicillium sp. MT-2017a]|nr:hypothetical protein K4F52_002369 [Lecanicillium sp. MT-2017a]
MDAPILRLPAEILLQILRNLNPFDLESVVKTYNRAFSSAASSLIKPHQAWMKNARAMCALFETASPRKYCRSLIPSFPGHVKQFYPDWSTRRREMADTECYNLGLDRSRGVYIRSSPPDLRSWMRLDGTFGWLPPLGPEMAKTMERYNGLEGSQPMAEGWQVDAVLKQAAIFGLTLPVGFETFCRSSRFHLRFPSYSAWYFRLGKIIDCPAVVDGGAGGYVMRFYIDQQACAFAYLYLSRSGGHCIIFSSFDVYSSLSSSEIVDAEHPEEEEDEEEEQEDSEDELRKEDFFIVGLTFEEYLVATYYEELLNFREFSAPGLKDYVRHVYQSPASVEHMRPYNSAIEDFFQNSK